MPVLTALSLALGGAAHAAKAKRPAAPAPAPAATAPAPVVPAPVDTVKAPAPDTSAAKTEAPALAPVVPLDSSAAIATPAPADTAAADTAVAKPKKRKRIVRETTVNTIDELKGRYRSPKKALFMSLVVPGLGQSYVGQHWFNYTRGAVYFFTDVALAYGWHYYVVDKQDRQITKYRRFADAHWSQSKYEDSISRQVLPGYNVSNFELRNPHRPTYCDAVQNQGSQTGGELFAGCKELTGNNFSRFQAFYKGAEANASADSIGRLRGQFNNVQTFYEIIGKEAEFITGWDDANNILIGDSTFGLIGSDGKAQLGADKKPLPATSANQQTYISMRAQANDYARMQAYFLGGIVLNHLVSAVDAALAANYHNKRLYQTETGWYDRVRLDSYVALDGYAPKPTVVASFTF